MCIVLKNAVFARVTQVQEGPVPAPKVPKASTVSSTGKAFTAAAGLIPRIQAPDRTSVGASPQTLPPPAARSPATAAVAAAAAPALAMVPPAPLAPLPALALEGRQSVLMETPPPAAPVTVPLLATPVSGQNSDARILAGSETAATSRSHATVAKVTPAPVTAATAPSATAAQSRQTVDTTSPAAEGLRKRPAQQLGGGCSGGDSRGILEITEVKREPGTEVSSGRGLRRHGRKRANLGSDDQHPGRLGGGSLLGTGAPCMADRPADGVGATRSGAVGGSGNGEGQRRATKGEQQGAQVVSLPALNNPKDAVDAVRQVLKLLGHMQVGAVSKTGFIASSYGLLLLGKA